MLLWTVFVIKDGQFLKCLIISKVTIQLFRKRSTFGHFLHRIPTFLTRWRLSIPFIGIEITCHRIFASHPIAGLANILHSDILIFGVRRGLLKRVRNIRRLLAILIFDGIYCCKWWNNTKDYNSQESWKAQRKLCYGFAEFYSLFMAK